MATAGFDEITPKKIASTPIEILFDGVEGEIEQIIQKEEMKEEEMKEYIRKARAKSKRDARSRGLTTRNRDERSKGVLTVPKRLQSNPNKRIKSLRVRGRGQKAGAFVDVIDWIRTNGVKKPNSECIEYTKVINIIILCSVSSVLLTIGGLSYTLYPLISVFGNDVNQILGYLSEINDIVYDVLITLKDLFVNILNSFISVLSTTISSSYKILLVLLQFLKNTGIWALGALQHVMFGAELQSYLSGSDQDLRTLLTDKFKGTQTYVMRNYDNVIRRLQTLRMTPERTKRLSRVRDSSYEYLMTPANFLTMTYMSMFNVLCDTIEASRQEETKHYIGTILEELVELNEATKSEDLPGLGYMGPEPAPANSVDPDLASLPPPLQPVGAGLSTRGKRKTKSKKSKKKKSKSKKDKVTSKKRK